MVLIRFKDAATEKHALGVLIASGLSGKSWKNGKSAVPEDALVLLARKGIAFEVLGPAKDEQIAPLRAVAAEAV